MKQSICILLYGALLLVFAANVAAETGKDNYQTYCVQCHGLEGSGNGINVLDMSTQPRDHTDAKEMSARTDQELFKVIKEGGQAITKSVLMPPWRSTLSDEEIKDLVKYLHHLCKC
jgi:cytochrome c oxidase cbb3-type subunit 3